MRKVIRLTESDLHHIIKESVKKTLRRINEGREMYDRIDAELSKFGDAHVSRFYSDENQITLAVHKSISRKPIIDLMQKFGYDYYTAGGNDDYIMMSFEPNGEEWPEERINDWIECQANYDDMPHIHDMHESLNMRRIIKESINKVLKESVGMGFNSCADKTSKEYKMGFQEGINDARKVANYDERNKLLDTRMLVLRKYREAFEDGYPLGEDPNEQWRLGWADGIWKEFEEADAYEELQNQDYEPGWQFNS